jgi:hypothetical protein
MVSIGRRVTRAFLIGFGLALIAGLAFFFITTGINMIAAKTVFDPVAIMLFVMGSIMVLAIGIELSEDIQESKQATAAR